MIKRITLLVISIFILLFILEYSLSNKRSGCSEISYQQAQEIIKKDFLTRYYPRISGYDELGPNPILTFVSEQSSEKDTYFTQFRVEGNGKKVRYFAIFECNTDYIEYSTDRG